jgi:hypothetical protein
MTALDAKDIIEAAPAIEAIDADAIRAEVAALDIEGYGETEDERTLARYLRRRAQLADERQRVSDWYERRMKSLESQERGVDFVMGAMAADITRRMVAGGKKKSVSTPWGTAGFRTTAARLVIADPDRLIAAAAKHPEWVRVEKKPVHAMVNEYFKATGEIPAGCEMTAEQEKFFTK